MQNPNMNIFHAVWFSACTAALLWFMYWIFYDLIVWNKTLTQVYPLNYFGIALSVSLILFSGIGLPKLESLCYLGATTAILWFTYWITYDIFVWNKTLLQVNTTNYAGIALSAWLLLVPKIISLRPQKEIVIETKTIKLPTTKTLIIPKGAPIKPAPIQPAPAPTPKAPTKPAKPTTKPTPKTTKPKKPAAKPKPTKKPTKTTKPTTKKTHRLKKHIKPKKR
jgi:cell division septation protein DedD